MNNAKILIVDQDDHIRATFGQWLSREEFTVFSAVNRDDATAILNRHDIEVTVIGAADGEGAAILPCSEIAVSHPGTEIILLTNRAPLDAAFDAADLSPASIFSPPHDPARILARIRHLLKKRRAEATSSLLLRAIDSCESPVVITDGGIPPSIVYANPSFERLTGYGADEILGRDPGFLHGDDREQSGLETIRQALRRKRPGKAVLRNYHKDGSMFWNELAIAPVPGENGNTDQFIGIMRDVSEQKRYEEELEYQSSHDGLTGLINRSFLIDRLQQALYHARRYQQPLAVLFLDLDHFKFINDSLGHDNGDRLLRIIADRLVSCLRKGDTVARQGGDDFIIVLPEVARSEDAAVVAAKVLQVVGWPLKIGEHELEVSCSIGISIFPRDGDNAHTLMKNADMALYRAKEQGRNNIQFFTDELNHKATSRMTMEKYLRRALERNEFHLCYQPQVDLRSGRITGMEALLRWQSPELGIVPPDTFIPLAEDTGLILPIGEWVLSTACPQAAAWQKAGPTPLTLAVNLSPRQFWHSGLVSTITSALANSGFPASRLELEIIESMVMRNFDTTMSMVQELKRLGIQLTIDDFGTGYSSLTYLKRFPFDKLKIDKFFIQDVLIDAGSAAIVRAIIAMARSLGLRVVAEGIETEAQLDYVRCWNCDDMQGYYFCRPVPADRFEQMLRENRQLPLASPDENGANHTLLLISKATPSLTRLKRILADGGYRLLTATSATEGFEQMGRNRVGVVLCDNDISGMAGTEFLGKIKEIHPHTVRLATSAPSDLPALLEAARHGAIFKFIIKPYDGRQLRDTISAAFRQYRESSLGTDQPPKENVRNP